MDAAGKRMPGYLLDFHDKDGNRYTVKIDKPANEPGGNLPMQKDLEYSGVVLSMNDEYPSDGVGGVSTVHPDEGAGNTLYHHSFFTVWQLRQDDTPTDPPIGPPVDPTPPAECDKWYCKLLKVLLDAFCKCGGA